MYLLHILFFSFAMLLLSCVSHDINKPVVCDDLKLNLTATTNASSCSEANGEIIVIATGGEQPYYFQLNEELTQSENLFSGLNSGIYNITVHDKNECTATSSNIVVHADNFKFTATIEEDTECINHNGSVIIEVQEGTAPYSYKINDGSFTENNSFAGLTAGNYTIVVKDAASCTAVLNITIPRGVTDTSWLNDILPIMTTSCAVSGCHDGKTRLDYRIYANAMKNAAAIKLNTQNRSMPFDGPSLSENKINLIACWVDDGALDN